MTATLSALARETESDVPKRREELHRIPELRFEEERTLAVVRREVEARAAARSRSSKIEVRECMRFGGEDFAWYLQARRGCFWFLGAQDAGSADHHAPRFNPDPTVFWRGVHYWLILATAPADAVRA
jgi:metal-dependent amidase/aminoacylase/carboxypeptidase family protein